MAISSLGVGAGVLTASVIDQLKAADTAALVTPIDTKITLQKQKGSALSLLSSLFTTFQTSVSTLNDSTLYQKRTVSGSNDAISVTADAGVSTQSFSLSDTVLAKKHVFESGSFTSTTAKIATGSGTMSLAIDGKSYDIAYTSSMSLDDLKTAINDKAGSKIKASTLQVGTNDYRLVLTSQETGASQSISISDSTGGSLKYGVYKKQDVITSGLFTSPTDLVSTATVTQSTKFSLSQALTDGGLSVAIDGVSYSAAFDTDHATTLANFKSAIDASGLYTASISGNDISITANTAGASYTITSPFSTTDSTATASTTDTTPASPTGTYKITMNGTTYNIGYSGTTTLQGLADSINTAVGSSVASIKQVGSSYQLELTSTAGGEDSTFSVSDSGGYLNTKLTSGITNYNVASDIQKASDATFKYNGISMSRSTNTITDIVSGLTINLLQDAGSSNIAVSQDVTAISDAMSSFVQSYNSLSSQLTSMTTADTDAGTMGVFNGDSSITSIARDISRIVTSMNTKGYSLAQFGIDLKQDGTMTYNSSTFTTKFNADTTASEQFFSGQTIYDTNGNIKSHVDGVFTQLNTFNERYMGINGTSGVINMFKTASDDALTTLAKDKTKAQALLNARYETMAARFSEYDTMMAKLNNQFSSLSQQISMAVNGK